MKPPAIAFALVFERSAGTTEAARSIRRTRGVQSWTPPAWSGRHCSGYPKVLR